MTKILWKYQAYDGIIRAGFVMGLLPYDADILPPSDDRIFKLILASPEGKPALMDLVSALIGRSVLDVVVRNGEIPPEDTGEKAERAGYLNTFSLRHDIDNGLLSDAIHVVYVELSKLKEITGLLIQRRRSLYPQGKLPMGIQMAGNILMSVSQDEKERAVFRSRKMYQTDMQSNWNTAYDKGEKRGRESGKQEVAINALRMNIPIADIAKMTGFSLEELENLNRNDG